MIDLKKLSSQLNPSKIVDPAKIFMTLPSRNKKYSYLRDVQSEVLEEWFGIVNKKDSIIKMNTGSGKTTVALLILKSCLSEKKGTAAYIAPDNYLVNQVILEAKSLGIAVATSENDIDFLQGESILVINIQKLFNGKSVFGMRNGDNISLNYILIDDVHACVDIVNAQFTIKLELSSDSGNEILELYKDDLRKQNEKKLRDIMDGDPSSSAISVPFWRIAETQSTLLEILQKYKWDEKLLFSFPLIGDILDHCNCTFTHNLVEIQPYSIPIHKITSFVTAERRIFMSATLCDDSYLLSHFDLKSDIAVITPKRATDIGDRMILFPQAYNPQITDEQIRGKINEYAKKYNVVVIVPSFYRSELWRIITNNIYSARNISEGVESIKSSQNGLYVFVNKYDGIDLPDDSCRLIVLDGLPDSRSAVDKLNENYLQGSVDSIKNKIQKIEQGMGRGVRSNNDYCGVIIMGNTLVHTLYSIGATEFFSATTRKQFEISTVLARELKNKSLNDIFDNLDFCINQNPEWVSLSKNALSDLLYSKSLKVTDAILIQRIAFNKSILKDNNKEACEAISEIVNKTTDEILKGFLMLEFAKYTQFIDPLEAQQILIAAQKYNSHILKPINGIQKYRELKKIKPQTLQIIDIYSAQDVNDYIVKINSTIDALVFALNTYRRFEKSLAELGVLLGFDASRPDDEYGIGPDVLWFLGDNTYFVIECKNEATNNEVSKEYCNQLLASTNWFDTDYSKGSIRTPILVYPTNIFSKFTSPSNDFRVIDTEKLQLLKNNIKIYCSTISIDANFKNAKKLSEILSQFNLTPDKFLKAYTKSVEKIK